MSDRSGLLVGEFLATLTAKGTCNVHAVHIPRIDRADGKNTVESHHIHPLEFDGPDTFANRVWLCPTGHSAVHELLRVWVRLRGEPPWRIRRQYHPGERMLAQEGYARIVAAGDDVFMRAVELVRLRDLTALSA